MPFASSSTPPALDASYSAAVPATAPAGEPAKAPPLPRWKRVLFSALLAIVVWGMLEGIASLYLRLTQGYDGAHLYQYEFDPYKNILPARGFVDTRGVRHNAQGFRRSSDVSVAKPAGTYRVFLMGASTAYGLGGLWPHIDDRYPVLTNDQTIDRYLEQSLQQALPDRKVEVINAAITSTWTHHSLIYLNQSILKYDPDMVLFLDGFNDYFWYDRGHDQFDSYAYNMPSRSILGPPTMRSLAHASGWWLFRKSPLAHVVGRAAKDAKLALAARREPPPPLDPDAAFASFAQVFPRNALAMHRRSGLILKDEGVIPVFMLQPLLALARGKPMPETERRLFEFNLASYRPNYEQYLVRAAEFAREREAAMAAQIGAEYIDLTRIFDRETGQMFTDYAHLTPEANQLLAQTVQDRILPLIRDDLARRCQASTPASGAPVDPTCLPPAGAAERPLAAR